MNSKPVVSVTPTFLLRGVDPIKVLNDYLQSKFCEIHLSKTQVPVSSPNLTIAPQHGTTPESETYVYRTKSNTQQVVVTTNHNVFMMVKASDGTVIPPGGLCSWCRGEIKNNAVGLPVSITSNQKTVTFQVDQPYYCRFECALSGLKRELSAFHLYRDPLYMDSEQMLRLMFKLMYPEAGQLQSAHDWKLHQRNNGPLNDEEFYSGTHTYIRMPNIITLPVKVLYLRSN